MAMTFFTATNTPLFSFSWIPDTTGQYAGTCIFLIVLAAIFRALLAMRIHFYDIFAYVTHRPQPKGCAGQTIRPWRASEVMTVGLLDVIIAGVGYLLMIAVMTMNVGYFLSVLAGVFVGSVLFGRFVAGSASH
ncbi:hypothetical protein M409DRAFT_64196 [Zasmidium cellare ATCC 36951]|uniref:Copper transport protein n=1 Tax=Zasmidium cellare ATCC 36951 TaxID=1080233 RepID=A0A6A6CTJ0_ZASCE|nr:uncharacterized protein M409DRAFT_64196 [Zasmidium cellare ATCC 36951]KAF2170464.1 hypothetical protein M409DRAFT_64196 [Zasmidium cellare ATCC 36951]